MAIIFLLVLYIANSASAMEPSAPSDPLTVTDVIVDKTADNAVLAREEAIAAAPLLALQKLAEQSLTAEDFLNFNLPEDDDVAGFVQDFEITNEKLSTTRYVGNFTVRFRAGIKDYIERQAHYPLESATGEEKQDQDGPALILPYFENTAGDVLLWEDPNPWRTVWQGPQPPMQDDMPKFIVPLGDINDVTAGPANDVWKHDYSVVEKLRKKYGVGKVVITAANRAGDYLSIDCYVYQNGMLSKKTALTPYVGDAGDTDAFRRGLVAVLKYLQELPAQEPMTTAANSAATPLTGQGSGVTLSTSMRFDHLATWMDAQKRIATIAPPVALEINSISKTGASFTVRYDGTIDALKQSLADQGIALILAGVDISGNSGPQKPLYSLQIIN